MTASRPRCRIGADGRTYSSRELVAGGSVVLFLDLHCPPCSEVARRWQAAIDDGLVPADRVFAVAFYSLDEIAAYRTDNLLTMPIYADTAKTFRTEHNVVDFPLVIYVGESGFMRGGSRDTKSPIDGEDVARRLAQ